MASIIVSKEAQKDLVEIKQYIEDELVNPSAALRILEQLKKSILSLESFPWRGKSLDALIPVHTEYRYLVCENYCIFYVAGNDTVIVSRVLHQRQDYLRALLPKD